MSRRINSLENANFLQTVSEEDRRDKILEDAFLRSTEENPYLKRVQYNIALCSAIQKEKRLDFLKGKRNQVRRLNNKELQQLESQLRAAYVSKAVAAQRFEQNALKQLEIIHRQGFQNVRLAKCRLSTDKYTEIVEKEEQVKKDMLKKDLQEQMAYRNAQLEEERLNLRKDREMMDNAVTKYREDKLKQARDTNEKKKKLKQEMDDFMQSQEVLREYKKSLDSVVNHEFEERIRERQLYVERVQREKKDRMLRRNKISDVIGKRTSEISEQKQKSLDLLIDLLIDERKAKEDMKQKQDEERKQEERIAIRTNLDRLHEAKLDQKLRQRKLDEDYRRKTELYLEERDQIKQQLDEEKKKKVEEHRRALQNAFDEKKRLRAQEMKNNMIMLEYEVKEKKRKERQVELERRDMLMAHGPHLKEFLPPKMLRESDKKYLTK